MWYKLHGTEYVQQTFKHDFILSYERSVLQCHFKNRSVQLRNAITPVLHRLADSYLPLFLFVLTDSKMRK